MRLGRVICGHGCHRDVVVSSLVYVQSLCMSITRRAVVFGLNEASWGQL